MESKDNQSRLVSTDSLKIVKQDVFAPPAKEKLEILVREYHDHLYDESLSVAKRQQGTQDMTVVVSNVEEANRRLRRPPTTIRRGLMHVCGPACMTLGTLGISTSIQGLTGGTSFWKTPGWLVGVLLVGIMLFAVGILLCFTSYKET